MSVSETSWISERSFVRNVDGNADDLEEVTTTLEDVSLFDLPQSSHAMCALPPVLASRREPQSVQNTKEPIAAMVS